MDFLTPRDISTMRYTQHHEWMEEVFSSPWSTGMIVPVDLGLGRKGELEELTRGFFEAPISSNPGAPGETGFARVGKMEAGKAEEFTKRATEKIAQMSAEMEKLKRQHAKRMAKLNRGTHIKEAEMRLRTAVHDPSDVGTEVWRLEGQLEASGDLANSEAGAAPSKRTEKVADILKDVEANVGKGITAVKELTCVQKGGLEERAANDNIGHEGYRVADSFSSGHVEDEDVDMATSPARVPEQPKTSTSTPVQNPPEAQEVSPQQHVRSTIPTPTSQMGQPSRAASSIGDRVEPRHDDEMTTGAADMDIDVEMPEIPKQYEPGSGQEETGDWILVDKSGDDTAPLRDDYEHTTNLDEQSHVQQSINTPGVFVTTPGSGLQGLTPVEQGSGQEELHTSDFGQFGELDTAGEALTGYGGQDGNVELEDHGDLGIDTSAFGDALHGTEGHEDVPASRGTEDASF